MRTASQDREITYKLYGGDEQVRIQQELLLGVGGVRALRALGLAPAVWHINEGHAAFMVLELIREQMAAGLDFAGAREAAAAPVRVHDPHAGRRGPRCLQPGADAHSPRAVPRGAQGRCGDAARPWTHARRQAAGLQHDAARAQRLASLQRREPHSWRRVEAHLFRITGRTYRPQENPVGYVTNGVHVPTFLDQAWAEFFDVALGEHWRDRMTDPDFWRRLDEIADPVYWNKRQQIKAEMLGRLRERLQRESRRAGVGDAHFGA